MMRSLTTRAADQTILGTQLVVKNPSMPEKRMRPTGRAIGRMLFATLVLAVMATPATATIDMSGVYEAIEFPCRYTFVQTGTDLQVTGPCSSSSKPLSATGTVDPVTGAFTVTGEVTDVCTHLTLTGTADGEMFTGTYTCDTGSGSVTATKCLNGMLDPGEDCQDGNAVDGDCCSSRCRFEPSGSTCGSDQNACTADICDAAGMCVHTPTTAPCDDGNACTVGDVCGAGTCRSGTAAPARTCAQGGTCERTVARQLSSCIGRVGTSMRRCYLETGAPCPPAEPGTAKALAKLASRQDPREMSRRCDGAGARLRGAGHGRDRDRPRAGGVHG